MAAHQEVPVPEFMAHLPRNKAGYVVPWFVAYIDGQPDFRVIRPHGIQMAVRQGICWLCGGLLEASDAPPTFVIGPMCAINRVSAEPPSHDECATYAVKVCPFMVNPRMVRRDVSGVPDVVAPAGMMITRNPGAMLLWRSREWSPFRAGDGVLFDVGEPTSVEWWKEGRAATRDEVLESIESGYPILLEVAQAQGRQAVKMLEWERRRAETLVPA